MTLLHHDDSPTGMIARLDASLLRRGENAILRRKLVAAGPFVTVAVRIRVRGHGSSQLIGEQMQVDQDFVMSPTQINDADWPGAVPDAPPGIDQRVPKSGDQLVLPRGPMAVQVATGIYVDGVLVRIKGKVRGR